MVSPEGTRSALQVGEAFKCQVKLRAFQCKKGDWIDEAKKVAAKL